MKEPSRREAIWDIQLSRLVESMNLYRLTEVRSGREALNPYVTGLLLSSSIMDELNGVTPEHLHLGWGQILDENDVLSGEIDILAYTGKPLCKWENVGFSTVAEEDVAFIIEVKRAFTSYPKLEMAFLQLFPYCKDVLLVIYETENSLKGIRDREEKLRRKGYVDVFHFVRWENDRFIPLPESWRKLLKFVSTWKTESACAE